MDICLNSRTFCSFNDTLSNENTVTAWVKIFLTHTDAKGQLTGTHNDLKI